MRVVSLAEELRGRWLAVTTFLLAYIGTTVIGATLIMTRAGRSGLADFLGAAEPLPLTSVGSLEYYLLLYLPIPLAPLFAYLGMRTAARLARSPGARRLGSALEVPWVALIGLSVVAGGYGLYELARADKLLPHLLFDSGSTYNQKIIERTDLMALLGGDFYVLVYAILPTLTACFLARFLLRGRRSADGAGFVSLYLLCHYLYFTIYLKTPFLLLALMLGAVVIVARASWLYLSVLGAVAVAAFVTMQLLLGGIGPRIEAPRPASEIAAPSAAGGDVAATDEAGGEAAEEMAAEPLEAPEPEAASATAGSVGEAGDESGPTGAGEKTSEPAEDALAAASPAAGIGVWQKVETVGSSVVFRMASSFPFYVEIFRDAAERCGVDTNYLPLLPGPDCVLPVKVFKKMYPRTKWVSGFAPAPAHVSAYGEVGLGYAIFIIALSGFLLGVLGAIGQAGDGPLFIAFNAVVVVFAYYLSQVPFVGALTYSHGLVFFLLPIGVLAVLAIFTASVGRLRRRSTSAGGS